MAVDRLFFEPRLAALYDTVCRDRPDFAFYLPLVMSADAVLDVGCGTGELLRLARQSGHTGRLCGLDPADAMLEQARARIDVDWILGDLSAVRWHDDVDLVVMTGHAFQVLLEDEEIRSSLAAIRAALTRDGCFAFETRNTSARTWEQWMPCNAVEVVGPDGANVRVETEVEQPLNNGFVRIRQTYTSPSWDEPEISTSTLRFLDRDELDGFLSQAGLRVEEQFGNWDRSPLSLTSPEIITVAAPA